MFRINAVNLIVSLDAFMLICVLFFMYIAITH